MNGQDGPVWCGVDLGTTNTKVLFLANDGSVLWRASRPTPRVSDGVGFCTDADTLFDLVEAMVQEGFQGAHLNRPLAAICVSGTGEDGLPLAADLRPMDLAIPWNDRRAANEATMLAASPLWAGARLPVSVDLTRTAAKWAWLRGHRPRLMAEAFCWVALTDYPAVRWTQRAFMSQTLAARTACYDTVSQAWHERLLGDCGAPRLPDVMSGGVVIGTIVTGRLLQTAAASRDTLVIAGGHDHPMAASLVCGSGNRAVLDSMGTAELVYVEDPTSKDVPVDHFFAASIPVAGSGTAWLGVMELSGSLEPLLLNAGPVKDLFSHVMKGEPVPGAIEAGGRRYFPWLDPLCFDMDADAATRLRAVLEGCAMYTRRLLDQAQILTGAIGPVYVTGGWARSRSLLQLRADVIGAALHRIDEPQLSALGSAALAARGCGMPVPPVQLSRQIIEPFAASAKHYDVLYRDFRAIIDARVTHSINPPGQESVS